MMMSGYDIHLENFEGPLDLLLHLIRKNEMEISDIPIAEITGQYLGILDAMKTLNLDIAGEFLLMAATLLHIKSKMLLPRQTEGQEDPRQELVELTDGGVGAGVDGKEQTRVPEIAVELLACDSGLHAAVQILGVDLQHIAHLGDVDAYAAVQCLHVPLERGPGAEGDDRRAMLGAQRDEHALERTGHDEPYVEQNPEIFSSEPRIVVFDPPPEAVLQNAGFITMDGPRHTAHRKVVQPVSSPRNLKKLEPIVRERVIEILDSLNRSGADGIGMITTAPDPKRRPSAASPSKSPGVAVVAGSCLVSDRSTERHRHLGSRGEDDLRQPDFHRVVGIRPG